MLTRKTLIIFAACAVLSTPALASIPTPSAVAPDQDSPSAQSPSASVPNNTRAYKIAQNKKSSNPRAFDANYDERDPQAKRNLAKKKKKKNPRAFDANYDERPSNAKTDGIPGSISKADKSAGKNKKDPHGFITQAEEKPKPDQATRFGQTNKKKTRKAGDPSP